VNNELGNGSEKSWLISGTVSTRTWECGKKMLPKTHSVFVPNLGSSTLGKQAKTL